MSKKKRRAEEGGKSSPSGKIPTKIEGNNGQLEGMGESERAHLHSQKQSKKRHRVEDSATEKNGPGMPAKRRREGIGFQKKKGEEKIWGTKSGKAGLKGRCWGKKLRKKKREEEHIVEENGSHKAPKTGGKVPGVVAAATSTPGTSSNWLQLQTTLANVGDKRQKKNGAQAQPAFRKGPPPSKPNTDAALPELHKGPLSASGGSLEPLNANSGLSKVIAIDCEMVGVGSEGRRSVLARVCMINASGNVVLDKHVRPLERVVDYRTHVSGVSAKHLKENRAEDFWEVQKEVSDILKNRILVGHALHNDLKALLLSHPKRDIRDTQRYKPLRKAREMASLKSLAERVLGVQIQEGQHDPVLDARAALYIYLHHRKEWERELAERWKGGKPASADD